MSKNLNEFSLEELNEIVYCIGTSIKNYGRDRDSLLSKIVADKLYDEFLTALVEKVSSEDVGPEYDSAGFTEDDRIVNGQYNNQ